MLIGATDRYFMVHVRNTVLEQFNLLLHLMNVDGLITYTVSGIYKISEIEYHVLLYFRYEIRYTCKCCHYAIVYSRVRACCNGYPNYPQCR